MPHEVHVFHDASFGDHVGQDHFSSNFCHLRPSSSASKSFLNLRVRHNTHNHVIHYVIVAAPGKNLGRPLFKWPSLKHKTHSYLYTDYYTHASSSELGYKGPFFAVSVHFCQVLHNNGCGRDATATVICWTYFKILPHIIVTVLLQSCLKV